MEHFHPYVELQIDLGTGAKLRFRTSCSQALMTTTTCVGNQLSGGLRLLHFRENEILPAGSMENHGLREGCDHENVRCDMGIRFLAIGQSPRNAY